LLKLCVARAVLRPDVVFDWLAYQPFSVTDEEFSAFPPGLRWRSLVTFPAIEIVLA